jgi:hypothetical protein
MIECIEVLLYSLLNRGGRGLGIKAFIKHVTSI